MLWRHSQVGLAVALAAFAAAVVSCSGPVAATVTATVATTVTATVTETAVSVSRITETTTEISTPDVPDAVLITGIITLDGPDNWESSGSSCEGQGGYVDLSEGTTVTVSSGNHDTLVLGALDAGEVAPNKQSCNFSFTVDDVPGGQRLYLVEVSHRGALQAEEVTPGRFLVMGSIGD